VRRHQAIKVQRRQAIERAAGNGRETRKMDETRTEALGDLGKLEDLTRAVPARRPAPVESWNPPYCGDIGLKIRRDGTWLYRDSPISRPAIVELFASVLRKDADGRTYLVTPAEKVDVAVEDAHFIAVAMAVRGEGTSQQLIFHTNVGDAVVCGPEHPLRFVEEQPGGGFKPYVNVRGRLEALVARALVHDLVALAGEDPRNGMPAPGVWSGGVFFPFAAGAAADEVKAASDS